MLHLEATEVAHKGRIGLIRCNGSVDPAKFIADEKKLGHDIGRMIYVAPGINITKRDPAICVQITETFSGAT